VSQRLRHAYAADLQRGLRAGHLKDLPGVPAAQRSSGTHRARPVSTRFEPVPTLKDVRTPVPRVLLSATLAGPAPSGSTGPSRLCQGCSRPPRHHPDQAALSFTALLRQDGGEGLSPPLEQQRLTAQPDLMAQDIQLKVAKSRLSGLARKFVWGRDQAARAWGWVFSWASMRWSRSLRSVRVNVQLNGLAIAL
jgi:hypothetical protein